MKDQLKEIILKQLQLLQEKSEQETDVHELTRLTDAMSGLLRSVEALMSYGLLD